MKSEDEAEATWANLEALERELKELEHRRETASDAEQAYLHRRIIIVDNQRRRMAEILTDGRSLT